MVGSVSDPEKVEVATMGTESTTYQSDSEKVEPHRVDEGVVGAVGVPDIDHEEVEERNKEHMEDLERQRTSIRAAPRKGSLDDNSIHRIDTKASGKSRLSRIATTLTSRSKKTRLEHPKIPVSDLDNGIVGWESQDDPEMPLNFPESRKWMLLALISGITFVSPLATSIFAPAVGFMAEDFHSTSSVANSLTVSIFLLGYVIGPLFLAPLSEIFGRRIVLTGANIFFCLWQIGCALAPNIAGLIVMRFMAGIGGSGCLTIGGGLISDVFRADRRGLATSLYSLGPMFGPVIGPIAGGFVAQRVGWRWIFWILCITSGVLIVGMEFLTTETNPRVLIHRKTKRLRKSLNRSDLQSCYDAVGTSQTPSEILKTGMLRPLKMLFFSPIVFLISLYMAVAYGCLYLIFTTITPVFVDNYGFAPDICGLVFIGLGIGFFSGLVVVAKISDTTVVRMTKANNGIFEPEMRLPACIFFACWIPVTFFWYGWTADKHVYWIVPVIGLIPFGFGMMGIFIPIQAYIIDSFPAFAASGLAALTVLRSLFGAFLPLAGPSMYASLGLGWGNTVLGFLTIGLIPAPLLIFKFGGRIRKNYPLKL